MAAATESAPIKPEFCTATLPYCGGALDKVAHATLTHDCGQVVGHDGDHRCEDCDTTWSGSPFADGYLAGFEAAIMRARMALVEAEQTTAARIVGGLR